MSVARRVSSAAWVSRTPTGGRSMKRFHVGIVIVCLGFAILAVICVGPKSRRSERGRPALAIGKPSESGRPAPKTVAALTSSDESVNLDVVIRATVIENGPVTGGELIDATSTSEVTLRPGWYVKLRVDECLRGTLGRQELSILVSHSPSNELNIPRAGGHVILRVRRAQAPVTLYSRSRDRPVQLPDVSAVAYTVSRAKHP